MYVYGKRDLQPKAHHGAGALHDAHAQLVLWVAVVSKDSFVLSGFSRPLLASLLLKASPHCHVHHARTHAQREREREEGREGGRREREMGKRGPFKTHHLS